MLFYAIIHIRLLYTNFFNHYIDVVGEVVACETMMNFPDDKGKTKR